MERRVLPYFPFSFSFLSFFFPFLFILSFFLFLSIFAFEKWMALV